MCEFKCSIRITLNPRIEYWLKAFITTADFDVKKERDVFLWIQLSSITYQIFSVFVGSGLK